MAQTCATRNVILTTCQGLHPRLGINSPIGIIGQDVVRIIANHLRLPLVLEKLSALAETLYQSEKSVLDQIKEEELTNIPKRFGRTYKYQRCHSFICDNHTRLCANLADMREMCQQHDRFTELYDNVRSFLGGLDMVKNVPQDQRSDAYSFDRYIKYYSTRVSDDDVEVLVQKYLNRLSNISGNLHQLARELYELDMSFYSRHNSIYES